MTSFEFSDSEFDDANEVFVFDIVMNSPAVEMEGPFGRFSAISRQHRLMRSESGADEFMLGDLSLFEVFLFRTACTSWLSTFSW